MKTIRRSRHAKNVQQRLRTNPVVALLGARQVGKTTLARELMNLRKGPTSFFDLEDPRDLARLDEPMLALEKLRGLIVLDEIQNRPELFPVLRVLADRPRVPARFLVLGSASPDLLRQGSESLAGRISFYQLPGFALDEIGTHQIDRLWLRGGLPRAFLTHSLTASDNWRRDYVRTFLERDMPRVGIAIPPGTLERFWAMLAHYHGQCWNASEFSRSFGVSNTTIRKYLDILTNAFVVTQLRPWAENVGKRVVKSPKVYISDSGVLHSLLGLRTMRDLERHPKLGASWEGLMVQQVVQALGARPEECYFWATHAGAELDLLVVRGQKRLGFEIKRTDTPKMTASMQSAMTTLKLRNLAVIHAGSSSFPLSGKVRAIGARDLLEESTRID